MILLIDNYDSFVYNLARYIEELGHEVCVIRNDAKPLSYIEQLKPDAIIISPGPCSPNQAGISLDLIKKFTKLIPMLGVCLGHQAIGQVFGGKIIRANRPVHGKTSPINHDGKGIFADLPSPMTVARYHSLIVDINNKTTPLEIQATSDDGIIMALRHKQYPVFGVQFHPEAILSQYGHQLLANFLKMANI